MALETATYINQLVITNPTSSDGVGDGDNHLRLIKTAIKQTFPNLTGAVSSTHSAINSAVVTANAATNTNTASTVVKRDVSGNFSAGTISAALTGDVTGNVTGSVTGNVSGNVSGSSGSCTGNAATATKLDTARDIALSGDVTGSASFDGSANIDITATVGDNSHAHTIANITGLQTALDNVSAGSASALTNARKIALSGDVTGNANFDGSADITIAAVVANNSHTHTIANVTGLQTALDGKVASTRVLKDVPSNALFTDNNTTYSVGDGGLSQKNFTSTLKTKLDGIESGAKGDQTATEILTLLKTVDTNTSGLNAATVDGFSISTASTGSSAATIYFRT